MNFAFHEDSGENKRGITLEREASDVIEWDFTSTSDVDLLIIKKSTLEYLKRVASEMSSQGGGDYSQLLKSWLVKSYVSKGIPKNSGKIYVSDPALYYIASSTMGTINYTIKCDPFSIDLMEVFYIGLGATTTIGIICSISTFKNLAKMKSKVKKDDSMCDNQTKVSCERCGVLTNTDSIFCYECGAKLKSFS